MGILISKVLDFDELDFFIFRVLLRALSLHRFWVVLNCESGRLDLDC